MKPEEAYILAISRAGRNMNKISNNIAVRNKVSGTSVQITDGAECGMEEFALYGESMQDGIPTLENPINIIGIGDGAPIRIIKSRKNFLRTIGSGYKNGITFETNEDGSYHIFGEPTTSYVSIMGKINLFPGTYYVSGGTDSTAYVQIVPESGVYVKNNYFTINKEREVSVSIQTGYSKNALDVTIYPMVELGSVKTEYAKYEEPVSLQLPLQAPLMAVGMSRDKIVKADGVWKIERNVAKVTVDNNSQLSIDRNVAWEAGYGVKFPVKDKNIYSPANRVQIVSDSFFSDVNSNSVGNAFLYENELYMYPSVPEEEAISYVKSKHPTFIYQLEVPVYEELPTQSQEALAGMEMYYGITNILNSEGAYMDVGYVADTKMYIDKKMIDMQALILEK